MTRGLLIVTLAGMLLLSILVGALIVSPLLGTAGSRGRVDAQSPTPASSSGNATTSDAPVNPPAAPPELGGDRAAWARMREVIAAIDAAQNPSDAVTAFARGVALDRNDPDLNQAYIQKLLAFDLPDLAVAPAQALQAVRPGDGLAWAILGLQAAKQGDLRAAVTDVVVAASRAPDDPFVLRTTAQVIAWYNTAPDQSSVPPAIKASLGALEAQLGAKPAYAQTYAQAVASYGGHVAVAAKPSDAAGAPVNAPTAPGANTPGAGVKPVAATVPGRTPAAPGAAPPAQVINNFYTVTNVQPVPFDPVPCYPVYWSNNTYGGSCLTTLLHTMATIESHAHRFSDGDHHRETNPHHETGPVGVATRAAPAPPGSPAPPAYVPAATPTPASITAGVPTTNAPARTMRIAEVSSSGSAAPILPGQRPATSIWGTRTISAPAPSAWTVPGTRGTSPATAARTTSSTDASTTTTTGTTTAQPTSTTPHK